MKKVLFIMHMPPPVHGAAMVGKYIKNSKLINSTFECQYINLTTASSISDIGKPGIKKFIRFLNLIRVIRKTVKCFKPDLIYLTPNSKGGAFIKDYIIISVIKSIHKNIIIHFHNKGVSRYQNRTLFNILYKRFFKNIKVILLAEVLYKDIEKYVKNNNVFICPNGIPTLETKVHQTSECFDILFLSNMMKEKGVYTLLEACILLRNKGYNFKCNFIGKWSDISNEDFDNYLKQNNLKNVVKSYGAKYGDEKISFYEKADCFVLPTYDDCFPLTLLEAMQYGIPCIASNEGAISDIIDDGKTGFVVEKKNAQQLSEKIEFFITHKDVISKFRARSIDKFNRLYTIDAFEKQLTNILNNILNKNIYQ